MFEISALIDKFTAKRRSPIRGDLVFIQRSGLVNEEQIENYKSLQSLYKNKFWAEVLTKIDLQKSEITVILPTDLFLIRHIELSEKLTPEETKKAAIFRAQDLFPSSDAYEIGIFRYEGSSKVLVTALNISVLEVLYKNLADGKKRIYCYPDLLFFLSGTENRNGRFYLEAEYGCLVATYENKKLIDLNLQAASAVGIDAEKVSFTGKQDGEASCLVNLEVLNNLNHGLMDYQERIDQLDRSRQRYYLLAFLLILASVFSYYFYDAYQKKSDEYAKVENLKPEYDLLINLQQRIKQREEAVSPLNSYQRMDLLQLVSILDSIMPLDTYFGSLNYKNSRLYMSGFSDRSNEVVRALQSHESFSDVRFERATFKDNAQNKEVFNISAVYQRIDREAYMEKFYGSK